MPYEPALHTNFRDFANSQQSLTSATDAACAKNLRPRQVSPTGTLHGPEFESVGGSAAAPVEDTHGRCRCPALDWKTPKCSVRRQYFEDCTIVGDLERSLLRAIEMRYA